MYAGAGYRTRTCRVTSQDVPTAPQRHTFTKTGITTIYTNKLVTSDDTWKIMYYKKNEVNLSEINKTRYQEYDHKRIKTLNINNNMLYAQNCFHMYAAAGYRTRTHRLTGLDVPTTPRRHTFTKWNYNYYYTNGLVTSNNISTNSVLQKKKKKKKKKKKILF
jgi:hypothetical protein